MKLKVKHTLCWSVPYTTLLEIIKLQSHFEDVPLESKSFFHLDHEVNIGLFLKEATALRHSKELAALTPS